MFRYNPDPPLRGVGGTGPRPWTKRRENKNKGAEEERSLSIFSFLLEVIIHNNKRIVSDFWLDNERQENNVRSSDST